MESLTRPAVHRKKLSKPTSAVMTSLSSKSIYDDVFSATEAVQRFKAPAGVDDYSEIFGGGSRGSSIPVLDLSALDETTENYRSSKVDYTKVFGGFEDALGVPYEELLYRASGNSKSSQIKARNRPEKGFPPQGEDTGNLSANSEEHPSKAFSPSLDAMKQFNMSYLKTSQENKNQPNGTTHVAKLHAVPGFTYFVNEPPSKHKTESGMPMPPIKGEVHRTWSFSGNVPGENKRNTEMLLPEKPTAEALSGAKGRSQSKDKPLNRSEGNLKSQSFKTAPSSNNFLESCGIRGHPKRSKSSNIGSKVNPFEKSTSNGTDGSSDEEFDINSDAAACAAALKKVLEKAQESIRLAKEKRERGEKDGFERFSNLSSEGSSSSAKDKKNGFDQKTNNSKKRNVKDGHERLGSELNESNEINNRLGSRSTGVSTASKFRQEPLTSTEAADSKSQLNIAKGDGRSKPFLEVVDAGKKTASTLAPDQVEMDKSSIQKQESETSLSMEKQESVLGETITAETTDQIKNNVEIEQSIEKDFGMGNAEKNMHIDEQTQLSEVTTNASDSAHIIYEFRRTEGLEITEKDARSEDMRCTLDERRHCEIKLPKCLYMSEEKHPENSKTKDQHMLEWQNLAKEEVPSEDFQNLAKEEVPSEDFQQVQLELQFVNSHSQVEREKELYSSKGGGMVHQDAYDFVASDDAPGVCGSGIPERAHKDSREGESCLTSNGLVSFNEGGMVQQDACGFVASDDAPEVCGSGSIEITHKDSHETVACGTSNGLDTRNDGGVVQQEACGFVASDDASEVSGSGSCEMTDKYSQEGDACETTDAIQEMGVDDSELISDHKAEEIPTVPCEEPKKKVVSDLDPIEKELVHVPHEEKSKTVLKEEHWEEGEGQKISVEAYEQVKVDGNSFGEEFDWEEVEKRIKKGCTNENTKETTGVHEEDTIDLLQKAAHEKNLDPDVYVSLHDAQDAHSTGVVEDHEASNSTTGTSEDFYNCEWEGNSEEEVLKPCDFTKFDEKSDFVQCPFEDCVSSSETSSPFMADESDENGTNANHNGPSHEHNLPQEDVLESTYFIQDAEKDINTRFTLQDISEDQKATAGSQGTVTDKNVEDPEPSPNCGIGDDFLYRFGESAEHVNEELSFDREDVDPKAVHNVENKENEIKSSGVTQQATVAQESVEEGIRGQSKPQKHVLSGDNEARESEQKDLYEKENSRKIEAMKRERERDKDRMAVERAIREVRERAFAEAKERADRAAVARAGAEVRQRMISEARERLEKDTAGTKVADKASIEAKQRAERAAVERATAEARERALEKALSQKTTSQGRVQTDRPAGTSKDGALKHSSSSSDLERFDGNDSESAQRRKARLERHERIMERAAKALAEKNMRDLQTQKEQAERNRLAESLDADVKRWANGKEKNLRALLSTLQYILGPDSGWQPISLTEIITTPAVKKAYRKATLYVHPDKLQQRGASIQQKYICEKVFDLLKAAWNKFNSEER